ncbi:MAG: hypothetical protein ACRBF0_01490 [Calditrichia bacterium]
MNLKTMLIVIGLIFNLSAQSNNEASDKTSNNTIQIAISDSAKYESHSSSGTFGLLSVNGVFVDTVDVISVITLTSSGHVIYQKIICGKGYDVSPGAVYGYPVDYLIYDVKAKTKQPVAAHLPKFNDYLSSPIEYNEQLYYWGFRSTDSEGDVRAFAMQHSFHTEETDSLFLFEVFLETDNPGFFGWPIKEENGIRYAPEYGDHWLVDFEKKLILQNSKVKIE